LIKIKTPPNLSAYIYKCDVCGSLVRYHTETASYFLVRVPKGGPRNCKFCRKLAEAAIPELIGFKVKEQ